MGSIECHASDAVGEEFLEYMWEPVGSTTRDYMDNPRLTPEDSPYPSVVAPEAPRYETLESFRSGETTFRYRYRLTATSRATGLSSSSEVEVFVSSSRPSVYCPLEVVVEEGSTVALDCEGVDPLSFRMDYDEDGASIEWAWSGLWGTSTIPLAATDLSSPLFTAPAGSAGKEYHYIASMMSLSAGMPRTAQRKVTVRVVEREEGGWEETDNTEDAEATVLNKPDISVSCEGNPYKVEEGDSPITLECSATGASTYTYAWTARDSTLDTDDLSVTDVASPTFSVPKSVNVTTYYRYRLTASAENADSDSVDVTVTVYSKYHYGPVDIFCTTSDGDVEVVPGPFGVPSSHETRLNTVEGIGSFRISCSEYNHGLPAASLDWLWTAVGGAANMGGLSADDVHNPTFFVPASVDADETYTYIVQADALGATPDTDSVFVTVRNKPDIAAGCRGNPYEVDEGGDITLNCSARGALGPNPEYTYAWTARGDTPDTNLLTSGKETGAPTFSAPDDVSNDQDYEYLLTVSSRTADAAEVEVTVTVKDTGLPAPPVVCRDSEVYEGAGSITLNCEVENEPSGATYSWAARGSTTGTGLLTTGTGTLEPTFSVPYNVEADTDYEYTVTLSAPGYHDAVVDITVTVIDIDIVVTCPGNPYEVGQGEDDLVLSCSASGAPGDAPQYTYVWSSRGAASNMALLNDTDKAAAVFSPPPDVSSDQTYKYRLTASAADARAGTADITVTVKDTDVFVECFDNPYEVDEGQADITLDCEATGPGDTLLMPDPSYSYLWTARGDTPDTALFGGTDGPSPTFAVPANVNADETYEYRLTVSSDYAGDGHADVTVMVKNTVEPPVVTCSDPDDVYEGSDDIELACSVQNEPSGATYSWAALGSTSDTSLLTVGANPLIPTFSVPLTVNADTDYEYTVTLSAAGIADVTAEVTVTVLNKQALSVSCASVSPVFEGSPDFDLDCAASGAPAGSEYDYVWRARGSTADTALLTGDTNGPAPTFSVPVLVNADEAYEYLLTVSAKNAEDAEAPVTVTVLNKKALSVSCAPPSPVFEGSPGFDLDCVASGAPAGSEYDYVWTAQGTTANTALLTGDTNGPAPTFSVPEEVDEDKTYEYLLTVSAENAIDATAEVTVTVTVTVLNRGTLAVACTPPPLVYEGAEDFALDCTASGAPVGSGYEYVWTARGSTTDTALLTSGTDGPTPTFDVPDALDATTTYEYLLTVSAENAESGSAAVTVTVLNRKVLSVVCTDPPSVYEGSDDFDLDCSASGARGGSDYGYVWTARGSTANTDLLIAGTDGPTPTFDVPDALDATTTYEYLLTASAENAESGSAAVTVTVLNTGALRVVCADTPSIYEGSEDFALDCTALGAPAGSEYAYAWTARGSTANTALLSATDISSPTFYVPDEVDETTTYEYLLTVSAENAENATAEVTVTVLNKGALALVCTDPGSVYEGSEDFALDCEASGAPAGSDYTYVWTARGDTQNTALLSVADIASPVFDVPDEVNGDETYEYLLTVSAADAESAEAEVTVTVLDRPPLAFVDDAIASRVYVFTVGEAVEGILLPEATGGLSPYAYTLTPALPEELALDDPTRTISGTPLEVSPRTEYAWQATDANSESVSLAFFVEVVPAAEPTSPPVAEFSPEAVEPSSPEPSSLGVTVSTSSLRFGVQSADTEVSLDPMTDQISTHISGPYHAGRMTLSPGGGEEALEDAEDMALSIELASPVVLRREGGVEDASIVLSPNWSFAESCEQLSSQAIGGLYTEVTLSEDACPLLLFGGELDLTDVPSGQYTGSMDIILRSGESEETRSVDVDVTVIPVQRVITIGPGGVRFSMSRELPAGLTEEQNLSIYPNIAFLTEKKPNGVFELSNPSLIPLEISVSARFGYTEATEDGREVVVEDTLDSRLGDLSQVVDIRPGVLVLMPGEKGLVRYGIQEGALAAMADKGYAAFFDVVSEPRQYVRLDQMPEEVSGEKTARVTMRVPGVYVPGEGASQLRATLLSISFVGPMSATFLLETEDHPFVGEVVAYDGDGRELGRCETLVYTRSRVRIPLDRIPEGDAVFLRFAPRGSERVPEPASVEWDAPRRDIGAADKDRTRTPETLVQKP